MLPDYPKLKERLSKLLTSRLVSEQKKIGSPVLDVPRRIQHEGRKTRIIREDGSVWESDMKKIQTQIKINLQDVKNMKPKDIIEKIDEMAMQAASQQSKIAYEEIEKAVREVGNALDLKGEKFKVDHFFQMLEKLWIDFDKEGKPLLPTIVAGEKAYKVLSEVLTQIENNSEYKGRMEEIIMKKKELWRDREANRKLVG